MEGTASLDLSGGHNFFLKKVQKLNCENYTLWFYGGLCHLLAGHSDFLAKLR